MDRIPQRIVLTGASGVLGRNFLRLLEQHLEVEALCLLRDISRVPPEREGVQFVRVDFEDPLSMSRIIEAFEPTCLVHCAATGMNFPKARWFSLIRFNVDVSINLCQCAAALPDCHFIHVSTGLGYRDQGRLLREDDPLDTLHPYGASKAAADILVRSAAAEFGVPMTVLRPFSFTGRWDESGRLFPMLLRAAAEQRQLDLSPGLQVRDHCSACDIAAGIWAAVRTPPPSPRPARVFNLGSGNTTPLKELVQQVVAQLDLRVELNFGARDYSPHEPMHLAADTQLAQRELGWKPEHNLAHAVWELAREAFPQLEVREPSERI